MRWIKSNYVLIDILNWCFMTKHLLTLIVDDSSMLFSFQCTMETFVTALTLVRSIVRVRIHVHSVWFTLFIGFSANIAAERRRFIRMQGQNVALVRAKCCERFTAFVAPILPNLIVNIILMALQKWFRVKSIRTQLALERPIANMGFTHVDRSLSEVDEASIAAFLQTRIGPFPAVDSHMNLEISR